MLKVINNKNLLRLNYIMLGVFILAIVVQFNDPDSGVWIALYGLAAVICVLESTDQLHWMLPLLICFSVVTWGLVLIPQIEGVVSFGDLFLSSWAMKSYAVELAREVGGLVIVLLWMLALSIFRNPFFVNKLRYSKI